MRSIFFVLGEGVLIFLAVNGVLLILGTIFQDIETLPQVITKALLVTLVFQVSLYYFDLYDFSTIGSFSENASRITMAFGVGCILLALPYYLFPATTIPFANFLVSYVLICLLITIWRFSYTQVLAKKMFARPVLLVGTGNMARTITAEIMSKMDSGFEIAAFMGKESPGFPYPSDAEFLEDFSNFAAVSCQKKIETIVVALDERRGQTPVNELLDCKLEGFKIVPGVEFYEELTGRILVNNVNPDWLIYSEGFKKGRMLMLSKRLLDFTVSLCVLLLSLPVALISSIAIKLESRGPVFYSQERTGQKGKPFTIYKFRSMQCDAETEGPVWARENDCRVTRFGAFMRKTRIDEIPQLWNILRGDMSFVGPRPERPFFIEQLREKIPYYSLRHNVKPGLTGWAQVSYRYGSSEEDALRKLEYDLYYIKNLCFYMDLMIVLQTVKIILFQKGSR